MFESLKNNKVSANKWLFDLCEVQALINKHVHKNKDNPHTNLIINNFFWTYNFNNKFILNIFNFLIDNNLDEIFSVFLNLVNLTEKYITINIKVLIDTEIFYSNFENQEEEDIKILINLFHQINTSKIFNNNILESIYLAYSDIIIKLFIKSHEKKYKEKETWIILINFIDIVNNNKYKNSIINEIPNLDYAKFIQNNNDIKKNIKENNPMWIFYFRSFQNLWVLWITLLNKYNEHPIKIHDKLNKEDFELLSSFMFDLNLNISDWINQKNFNNLSSWEKITLSRFTKIYQELIIQLNKKIQHFTILIDEPDLHLHLDWQRQYIQKLIDVFSTLDPEINLHFIIATHSPFIISDLPTESMVVLDKSEKNIHKGEFVEVKGYSKKDENWKFIHQTFGANYIDIIKNGFFFENKQMLMGSFAQENIENASKKLKTKLFIETLWINNNKTFEQQESLLNNILEEIWETEIKEFDNYEKRMNEIFDWVENVQNHIWDDFLQDNLMYLN